MEWQGSTFKLPGNETHRQENIRHPALSCGLLSRAMGGGRTMEVAVSFRIQDRTSLRSYVPNTGEGVSPKLDSFLQLEAILEDLEENQPLSQTETHAHYKARSDAQTKLVSVRICRAIRPTGNMEKYGTWYPRALTVPVLSCSIISDSS